MIICRKCGSLFFEHETDTARDEIGETYSVCPECGSTRIEQAVSCERCMRDVPESETIGPYCKKCFEAAKTVEAATSIGDMYTDSIEVNSFYVYLLGEEKVNQMIADAANAVSDDVKREDAIRYCSYDDEPLVRYMQLVDDGKSVRRTNRITKRK